MDQEDGRPLPHHLDVPGDAGGLEEAACRGVRPGSSGPLSEGARPCRDTALLPGGPATGLRHGVAHFRVNLFIQRGHWAAAIRIVPLRIPLPGAYPVLALFCVNLVVGGLLRMVGQRRRLLDYLKATKVDRYRKVVSSLNLRK